MSTSSESDLIFCIYVKELKKTFWLSFGLSDSRNDNLSFWDKLSGHLVTTIKSALFAELMFSLRFPIGRISSL